MKNKNWIIILELILFAIIIINMNSSNVYAIDIITIEDNYFTDSLGFVHFENIYNFLYSVEQGFIKGKVSYDASLDEKIIADFGDYFSSEVYSYEEYQGLYTSKDDFVIYFANLNSDFIDEKIINLALKSGDGMVLYREEGNKKVLYVVLKDTSLLLNMTLGLEFYEDFYIEKIFDESGKIVGTKFGAFSENFAFLDSTFGFYSIEYEKCDPAKETDRGDIPERAGCLNNGVSWTCDKCSDNRKMLVEFVCDKGYVAAKIYKCTSCNNGACKPECQVGWLDEYTCQKATSIFRRGKYDLMRAYNTKSYYGKCVKSWRTYKQCGDAGCDSINKKCDTAIRAPVSGRAVSEERINIFSRIANFFRNLFG